MQHELKDHTHTTTIRQLIENVRSKFSLHKVCIYNGNLLATWHMGCIYATVLDLSNYMQIGFCIPLSCYCRNLMDFQLDLYNDSVCITSTIKVLLWDQFDPTQSCMLRCKYYNSTIKCLEDTPW